MDPTVVKAESESLDKDTVNSIYV